MSNKDTPICAFNSNECNGKINKVGNKISLISCGMLLCMFHYNKFILNENRRLEKNLQVCSYPKHDEYKSQSKNATKKPNKLSLEKVPKRFMAKL